MDDGADLHRLLGAGKSLRPIIFARGLKTPMLVIIVGVIGGTLSSGIIGLFVGPILLAVTWDLLLAFVRDKDAVST